MNDMTAGTSKSFAPDAIAGKSIDSSLQMTHHYWLRYAHRDQSTRVVQDGA
jgi:hypothetical protein